MKKPVKLPAINRKVLSMKTLLRIFSIALVSGVALVSCGKITPTGGNEQGGDTPGTETGGGDEPGGNTDPDVPTRVLSVSFDTEATRTCLGDNGYPYFEKNDVILLATTEGEARTEECTVYYRNGVAMIETSLPGDLRAVYPAAAADLKNGRIVGVKVPAVQTGLFKDANICMVDEIPIDATKVTFKNQTALIVVPVPQGTTRLVVTSLGKIGMSYLEPDYALRTTVADINTEGADEAARQQIIIDVDSTDLPKDYYVSVLPYSYENQLYLTDLNIDAVVDAAHGSMGGFSPYLIEGLATYISSAEFTVNKNAIYNLPAKSLHEYVELDGLRWATMNVGASSTTDNGDYFSWGGIIGHQFVDNAWTRFDNDLVPGQIYSSGQKIVLRDTTRH